MALSDVSVLQISSGKIKSASAATARAKFGAAELGDNSAGNGGVKLKILPASDDADSVQTLVVRNKGDAADSFSVKADGTVDIGVTGKVTTIKGDLQVDGIETVTGTVTYNGHVNLGNAAADTITFIGVVDSTMIPDGANTRDMGSTSKEWRALYIGDGANSGLYVGQGQELRLSVTSGNALLDGSGTLAIGTATAGAMSLGRTGQTVTAFGNLTVNENFGFNTGVTVADILDEDTLSSNSATSLATQQSIKAYVDAQSGGGSMTSLSDTTISAEAGGHLVVYDGTDSWDNVALSGDATLAADGTVTLNSAIASVTSLNAGLQITGGLANIDDRLDLDAAGGTLAQDSSWAAATFDTAVTENGAGTHARISTVEIGAPAITGGVGAVTAAASLYIAAAPSASGADNYALWVDAGNVQFDAALNVGTTIAAGGLVSANLGLTVAGGALTITNQAITQTTGGQVTFAGNVNADSGVDVAGASLTLAAGVNLDMSAGLTDFLLPDNQASALRIMEGANTYMTFVTTNSQERIVAGKSLRIEGGLDFMLGNQNAALKDNDASALVFAEAGNSYLTFVTTNAGEKITIHKDLDLDGNIDALTAPVNVMLKDNQASAWSFQEAGSNYLQFVTTDGSEEVKTSKLLHAAAGLTLDTGGTLDVDVTSDFSGNVVISGSAALNITSSGAINQSGAGQVTFTGNVSADGGLDVSGAVLTTAAGLTVDTGGTLDVDVTSDFSANVNVSNNADITFTDAATSTVNGIQARDLSSTVVPLTNKQGAQVAANKIVYLHNDVAGNTFKLADADSDTTAYAVGVTAEVINDNTLGRIWTQHGMKIGGFSSLTLGAVQYLSATAGGLTETAPAGAGDVVYMIGVACSATEIIFMPQFLYEN